MNKKELTVAISNETGLTQKNVETVINCLCSTVASALERGEKVQLIGFGSFEVRERKARVGQNPRTGERVTIEAGKAVAFKAGKALKDRVNAAEESGRA